MWKKNIRYILSFSILMKVYLYCLFPPIDWLSCSLDAEFIDVISCFVFAKRKWEECFCNSFKIIPQQRCEVMYLYSKESTYQPTVWPVQYTVFLCLFVEQFVKARLFDWDNSGQPGQKTWWGGFNILHFNSISAITQTLQTQRIRSISLIRNDAGIFVEKMCDQ